MPTIIKTFMKVDSKALKFFLTQPSDLAQISFSLVDHLHWRNFAGDFALSLHV
jgi:hypothetical protein